MSQLTAEQQQALRAADENGRALVTVIDDRLAIILPPCTDEETMASYIADVTACLSVLPRFNP